MDELKKLNPSDGVKILCNAPADNDEGYIPAKKGDPGCHLWVITSTDVPYILERQQVSPALETGVVKHTNLTGGGIACCGGELWFETPNAKKIYINGLSARYGPESQQQLTDAVEVFEQMGYNVVNFGWDKGANLPHMVLRNDD